MIFLLWYEAFLGEYSWLDWASVLLAEARGIQPCEKREHDMTAKLESQWWTAGWESLLKKRQGDLHGQGVN